MKSLSNGAKIMKENSILQNEYVLFLNYCRAKFPIFHNSKVFNKDLQYAVMKYLEKKGEKVTLPEAEVITEKLIAHLEGLGILVKINESGWKLNYPEFLTQKIGDPL
ncbi:MAG TPA: hypothetical protein VMV32_07065 [Ignavibacteriaceae bacterium]|nr:hypothetical protein [Ignavibacteriaceae bacterium]